MADAVTTSELMRALDELVLRDGRIEPLRDDEVTILMVRERAGCSATRAVHLLEKWVADGSAEFVGQRIGPSNRPLKAWRLVKPKKESSL